MPKFLFSCSYTEAGLRGLMKEGGSARREATRALAVSLRGSLDAYYFAFGTSDVYLIADLPSQEAAAALAMMVGASGAATVSTTVLLEPEQIDAARDLSPEYRPPGS
ncbi:MAG TPA: GYD domain-containing protein [Acidimicrobiales bacterium]|nr:GYD domain-containing protein [Acidimicrobiales bacterium]